MVGRFSTGSSAVIVACWAFGCGGKSVDRVPPAGSDAARAGSGGDSAAGPSSSGGNASSSGGDASSSGGHRSPGNGDAPSTGASGGTATDPGCSPGDTLLIPNVTGWVDHADACNDVGVQGAWYAFGDAYGAGPNDAPCITIGAHLPEECAVIDTPPPAPAVGFPNMLGLMHTEGTVEKILPCVDGSEAMLLMLSGCPAKDYETMTGAGIGFDLNADGGSQGGARHTWDPAQYGVVGLRFTLDAIPATGMRVEFPMLLTDAEATAVEPVPLPPGATTEQHPSGSPYWGAQRNGDGKFPNSPVSEGENTVYFSDVQSPKLGAYQFDTRRLLGVHFHVPPGYDAAPYAFTISKVTFLRE